MNRRYDAEFDPSILRMLKKREILGHANPVNYVALDYNLGTFVEEMEAEFQEQRRANALLETTPPEAWLTAEMVPHIQTIRANADVPEEILNKAVQRYFSASVKSGSERSIADRYPDQVLHTTIEPYKAALKSLLDSLFYRTKSLQRILSLPPNAYSIRPAMPLQNPTSQREAIFLKGVREDWKNERIAMELDVANEPDKRLKPRSGDNTSYSKMLHDKPQLFYAVKSAIKRKYSTPGRDTSRQSSRTSS